MKHRGLKFLSLLLTLALLVGLLPGMSSTAYAAEPESTYTLTIPSTLSVANNEAQTQTETLLTSITTDMSETITYSTAGCATLTTSGNVEGTMVNREEGIFGWANSSPYTMGSLTVTPSEGYTITKVVFKGYEEDESEWFDVFTDTEAPYTCYMKSSHVSLSENMANKKGEKIAQIDVYGYVTPTSTAVTGVTLNKTSATLAVGGTETLIATVAPTNATDKKVKWSVGGENANAVALYADANCTAPLGTNATDVLTVYAKGISAGSATVTCTSNADSNKSASCDVTVNAAGYTVTYQPGRGSGTMEPTKVSKNDEGKYIYKVESCGFTAPEGETFDYWLGSDGNTYRPGPEVEINDNLTLTAQWKDEEKPDGGEKKTGGSGFDLVFNIPGADNSWEYVGGYAPQYAYRVSLAPMQGGSAALGLTTGESGVQMNVYPTTTVYVFPNAAQGYVLDKIVWSLIDGSASYDITEAKNFVMPAMDVVVYVTFQPLAS